MKPLNSKERTTGLLKFAGLFLFTNALVCLAIYFDVVGVPKSELSYYTSENVKLVDSVSNMSTLHSLLTGVTSDLIKYKSDPGNNLNSINVAKGISNLDEIARKDSISYAGKISSEISKGYAGAAEAIKASYESGSASADVNKLKEELKQLKEDLDKKDQQILTLQVALSGKK